MVIAIVLKHTGISHVGALENAHARAHSRLLPVG
jgi:hypothetical protein